MSLGGLSLLLLSLSLLLLVVIRFATVFFIFFINGNILSHLLSYSKSLLLSIMKNQ